MSLRLLIACVLVPVVSWVLIRWVPPMAKLPQSPSAASVFPKSPVVFRRENVGPPVIGHPRICHVQVANAGDNIETAGRENTSDSRAQVIVCDAARNAVLSYEQTADGWNEKVVLSDVVAPAHATLVDVDADSDMDIVVSVLGNIEPDDGVIGRVVLLMNNGGEYAPQTILDDVRRVADVQPGDFDADGDVDLAVAVFGYNRGQVLWLEQTQPGKFLDHELLSAPGTIHVPVADYDNDGDPDIAAIVTQDEEELWGFENDGTGNFEAHRLWFTPNFDLGSAGLIADDLDRDGDVDLILPAGDNLEDFDPFPQPYHGCLWFENKGAWDFEARRIADFGGTYAAAAGDLDNDDDTDVVLVSMANLWDAADQASIVWLENDGQQNFKTWRIDTAPTHLVTVAIGDLDGDGRNDIVAGGLHIRPPYNRIGRVTAWFNAERGGQP